MTSYTLHGVGMTNSSPSEALAPPDPRPGLSHAMQLAGEVVGQVSADHLNNPTPCPEFTVEQLVAHSLGGLEQLIMIPQGLTEWPDLVPDTFDPAEFASSWARLSAEVQEVWADDSQLGKMQVLPWAEAPGFAAVGFYISEVLVHTWDLAKAIGVEVDWDQDLAAAVLDGVKMGLPVEGREDPEMPFDPVVQIPVGAPAMDQLLAFMGRNPNA